MKHMTAADLTDPVEFPQCVKLYAPGAGNNDRVFIFPYSGRLSDRKVSIMADHLVVFYPRQLITELERAVRNTAERCAWTRIETFANSFGKLMCSFRGDGWMNTRKANAVIIFITVRGD